MKDEQARIVCLDVKQLFDIVRRKNFLRRAYTLNLPVVDADYNVGNFLRQLQLVEGQEHRQITLLGHLPQDGQQLQLVADVQEGGGLVQHNHLRLLAQGPGQQHPLPLAIADLDKIQRGQFLPVDQSQGLPDFFPVCLCQQTQPPGVGVAAHGHHIPAGHQLRAHPLRHQDGQLLGPLQGGQFRLAVQKHRPLDGSELANDGFQDGGLPRAVGPDEGHDLPRHEVEADIFKQGLSVVAHRQIFCFNHAPAPSWPAW